MEHSKFAVNDSVDWPEAGLKGVVRQVGDHGISVDFDTTEGVKPFHFQTDGRMMDWCPRPSIQLSTQKRPMAPVKKGARAAIPTETGFMYLYESLQDAVESGLPVLHCMWAAYDDLEK